MTTAPLRDNDVRQLARLGLVTGYDLRLPDMFRVLNALGAVIGVVPAAWPLSRVAHCPLPGKARAVENESYVVQRNDGGSHKGIALVAPTRWSRQRVRFSPKRVLAKLC